MNRNVSFSESSEMVLVTNLSLSPDKHMMWFTKDELEVFRANMTCSIRLTPLHISRGNSPRASDILGLEKFLTTQLTEEFMFRRSIRTREVLREARSQQQERVLGRAQRGEGYDIDRLSRVSARYSKWARERARAAALFLEQDQASE